MADDEPQPGPSTGKRKRTAKKVRPDFVTSDVTEVLELLDDPDFEQFVREVQSDDSFEEDEVGQAGTSVRRSADDVNIPASLVVRADTMREERAELEAEYNSDRDPDYEPDSSDSERGSVETAQHHVTPQRVADSSGSDSEETVALPVCSRPRRARQRGGMTRSQRRGLATQRRQGRARTRGGTGRSGRAAGAVLENPLEPPNMKDPDIPAFIGQPGLKVPVDGRSPLHFFRLFLTNTLLELFIAQTNLYACQTIAVSHPQQQFARIKDWKATDAVEMEKFIGLVLLTGLVSKSSIESYWSTLPTLNTPIFREVMSRNRFQALLRFWHCNDNTKEPARNAPDRDRLFKIRPLVTILQELFQTVYTPDKFVAIDESLLLWKGQLVFKQYIPLKRARFGIKLFNVCEDSGYTCKFHIYTGKQDPNFQIQQHIPAEAAHLTSTEQIVLFMTSSLLDKGYRLFMDNWYSGSRLYQYMVTRGTACCGTIRENRVPLEMRQLQVNQQEPMKALRSGQLLFVKWQSSKVVYMLSTMHNERMEEVTRRGGQKVLKPSCVVSYNSKMGAVDRADQMLQPYDATRKTKRWYKKVMVHLLQISLLNAFILHKKVTQSSLDFVSFQNQVIDDLIIRDNPAPQQMLRGNEDVIRLTERHFPRKVPQTGATHTTQRRCKVCSKHGIRSCTSFMCQQCPSQPALCSQPCFELYHTVKNY